MGAAPTGQPLRSVAELGLVIGMTPGLLARISPYLSVLAPGPLQAARADPLVQEIVRSLGGDQPASSAASPPTMVNITADARGTDGSRFIRHAVVSLGQDHSGRLFRILVWEALPAPGNGA